MKLIIVLKFVGNSVFMIMIMLKEMMDYMIVYDLEKKISFNYLK